MPHLKIHEIYFSIQGESSHIGRPCIFIRTTGCKLRCSWCDTTHAFHDGNIMSFEQIHSAIAKYPCKLVEVTGGEPMEQEEIVEFLQSLLERDYEVLMETGGHVDLSKVPSSVHKIMDVKCPGSRMHKQNKYENFQWLDSDDEVKFVVLDRQDFDFCLDVIKEHNLQRKCEILLSPVHGKLAPEKLVEWTLSEGLQARFQLQIHKYIWSAETRGV